MLAVLQVIDLKDVYNHIQFKSQYIRCWHNYVSFGDGKYFVPFFIVSASVLTSMIICVKESTVELTNHIYDKVVVVYRFENFFLAHNSTQPLVFICKWSEVEQVYTEVIGFC